MTRAAKSRLMSCRSWQPPSTQRDYTRDVERRVGRIVPHVFHRNGKPTKRLDVARQQACRRAGVLGKDGRPRDSPRPPALRRPCARPGRSPTPRRHADSRPQDGSHVAPLLDHRDQRPPGRPGQGARLPYPGQPGAKQAWIGFCGFCVILC